MTRGRCDMYGAYVWNLPTPQNTTLYSDSELICIAFALTAKHDAELKSLTSHELAPRCLSDYAHDSCSQQPSRCNAVSCGVRKAFNEDA
eukprot:471364-Pelagomonas_calceolata.AAC.3